MTLDLCFTPAELPAAGISGRLVVIIDVLRATSTILEALSNGARVVCPAATPEEATSLAQRVGRQETLLGGERKGVRIDGFDLGNSPLEYTRDRVAGKLIAMTTTNGTEALISVSGARRVLLGSFLNLSAVADAMAEEEGDGVVVCAGRDGFFALEDAVCAGALVLALRDRVGAFAMNDAGTAASALAKPYRASPLPVLKASAGGKALLALGFESDVAFCATVDRLRIVPELRDRQISAPRSAEG